MAHLKNYLCKESSLAGVGENLVDIYKNNKTLIHNTLAGLAGAGIGASVAGEGNRMLGAGVGALGGVGAYNLADQAYRNTFGETVESLEDKAVQNKELRKVIEDAADIADIADQHLHRLTGTSAHDYLLRNGNTIPMIRTLHEILGGWVKKHRTKDYYKNGTSKHLSF